MLVPLFLVTLILIWFHLRALLSRISVAKLAADSVKRVHQELGGKSANILLDDSTFEKAVTKGVRQLFSNSGQSCNALPECLFHQINMRIRLI